MNKESKLMLSALNFEEGHNRRSNHILKVYALAKTIADCEGLSEKEKLVLHASAILHDIGIKICKEKYGDASQELQRKEAPLLARELLKDAGYEEKAIHRILYLIKMHHSYEKIDRMDFQILVEADLMINVFEEGYYEIGLDRMKEVIKTRTGKDLLHNFLKTKLIS